MRMELNTDILDTRTLRQLKEDLIFELWRREGCQITYQDRMEPPSAMERMAAEARARVEAETKRITDGRWVWPAQNACPALPFNADPRSLYYWSDCPKTCEFCRIDI